MILSLYLDPKFTKTLNELRKQGGISFIVAKKADDLIKRLLLRGRDCSYEIGKLTKNGELRIRKCKKYDLGNGYRLICLRKASHLILLNIGTHDECTRWIERNRGLEYDLNNASGNPLLTKQILLEEEPQIKKIDPADEYEERLISRIDDRMLRKIFSGLCIR
jgi:hypothetical protein